MKSLLTALSLLFVVASQARTNDRDDLKTKLSYNLINNSITKKIRITIETTCGTIVSFDSPLTGTEDDSVFEGLADLFNYQFCGVHHEDWDIVRNP